jgi:hypothetical protein
MAPRGVCRVCTLPSAEVVISVTGVVVWRFILPALMRFSRMNVTSLYGQRLAAPAVIFQLRFVFDDADLACDFWSGLLELGNFALGFGHGGFGPKGAAAADGTPFAGHVIGFYVGADSGDVAELEGCYFRSAIPEEWLAMTAVLYHCVSVPSDSSTVA